MLSSVPQPEVPCSVEDSLVQDGLERGFDPKIFLVSRDHCGQFSLQQRNTLSGQDTSTSKVLYSYNSWPHEKIEGAVKSTENKRREISRPF